MLLLLLQSLLLYQWKLFEVLIDEFISNFVK